MQPIVRIVRGALCQYADVILGDFRVQIELFRSQNEEMQRRISLKSSVVVYVGTVLYTICIES